VAVANEERVDVGIDQVFDPLGCLVHAAVASNVRAIANLLHQSGDGAKQVDVEEEYVIANVWYLGDWHFLTADLLGTAPESRAQVRARKIVITRCVDALTHFVIHRKFQGWRCLATCLHCRKFFIQRRVRTYCDDSCEREHNRAPSRIRTRSQVQK